MGYASAYLKYRALFLKIQKNIKNYDIWSYVYYVILYYIIIFIIFLYSVPNIIIYF
jgi:hypothetical protein